MELLRRLVGSPHCFPVVISPGERKGVVTRGYLRTQGVQQTTEETRTRYFTRVYIRLKRERWNFRPTIRRKMERVSIMHRRPLPTVDIVEVQTKRRKRYLVGYFAIPVTDMSRVAFLVLSLLAGFVSICVLFRLHRKAHSDMDLSHHFFLPPLPRHERKMSLQFATDPNEPEWAAFYNVYVSPNATLAKAAKEIIEEQIGQLGVSYAAATGGLKLYYNTIGSTLSASWMHDLCSVRYNITCVLMNHFEAAHEDKTLARVHEFCQQHESKSVIYLHSKGSFHPSSLDPVYGGQDGWRRAMTAAASSEMCLNPADDTCNACGLLFQPLPGLHFPGNMWTAKCSYVKNLLSPEQFHDRRPVVDRWVTRLKRERMFQANLFHYHELNCIGKGRYESEHWMGSHPSLRPCDVSSTPYLDYWLNDGRNYSEFAFSMAPRHPWSANWVWHKYSKRDTHNATFLDQGKRMKDYFLLRGVIFRWLAFYEELPDSTSWAWSWFPDGELWKQGVEEHGEEVVDALVPTPIFNRIVGTARSLIG